MMDTCSDPETAADDECAGDVEQFCGDPAADDDTDIAVDAFLAQDDDDLPAAGA